MEFHFFFFSIEFLIHICVIKHLFGFFFAITFAIVAKHATCTACSYSCYVLFLQSNDVKMRKKWAKHNWCVIYQFCWHREKKRNQMKLFDCRLMSVCVCVYVRSAQCTLNQNRLNWPHDALFTLFLLQGLKLLSVFANSFWRRFYNGHHFSLTG